MMSINDRITQMRENSSKWRERVQPCLVAEQDTIPKVSQIRRSLTSSQEQWHKRVMEKDASNFTVAGRMQQSSSNKSSDPNPSPLSLEDAVNFPHRPPAVPILRATYKENRPSATSYSTEDSKTELESSAPSQPTTKQTVSVPSMHDEVLTDFFTDDVTESQQFDQVQLNEWASPSADRFGDDYQRIANARRAARPEGRRLGRSANPLKSLAQRTDLRTEYEEVRCSSAMLQTPFQQLLGPVDPAKRLQNDADNRRTMLAESAIAGLSSRENFCEAKDKLRQVNGDSTVPLSSFQRNLLPYRSVMLLHVKGRRHVQVRLVCPTANSLNSGDCFILVCPDVIFAWFGSFANVVEVNKTRELASWIHKHHELGYRASETSHANYISVHEFVEGPAMDNQQSAQKFWRALGYDEPQVVQACGASEEDELYEVLIQHTNRVYQVTNEQLVPCMQYWGQPLKHKLLQTDQAFVFDFGSEVYLWTGTRINPELRQAGIELVRQTYSAPYDYSHCRLNPLDPLLTHGHIPLKDGNRPEWTLIGKVTEKGETVLFKEKFIDWPDANRLALHLKPVGKRTDANATGSVYSTIQPYSVESLYQAAFQEPPPPPLLLTLEGRFVGRGGEGCRHEDGIVRRFRVESGSLRIWHISEFNRFEIDEESHGQFHQGDTYVVRWPFKIHQIGLRDTPSRSTDRSREQCAYFFWQGSLSKVTEKGAAAVMTIELDTERGPQVRVPEGKEPPAFCRLFNGRMIIHAGKRTGESDTYSGNKPRLRVFLVRGEVPVEGYLLEVPPQLSSLRSRGVFLVLQYAASDRVVQKAWVWCGRCASQATMDIGHHIVNQLKERCPPELATNLPNIVEVRQTEEKLGPGELVFLLNAEDSSSSSICSNIEPSQGPLVIWHLTVPSSQHLKVRRLSYTLQPDATLTNKISEPQSNQGVSNASPMDVAKLLSERLKASSDAVVRGQQFVNIPVAFPFQLRDLYSAPQPALFLVLSGTDRVFLWQGWWPLGDRPKSQAPSLSSTQGSLQSGFLSNSTSEDASYEECAASEFGDGASVTRQADTPESAKIRFHALRQAALKTAQSLAEKIESTAVVVYAGLEPPEFLCLFPPFERNTDASAYHIREEGKADGQMDPVNSQIVVSNTTTYSLEDLQQRPLPEKLNATRLEMYLSDEDFQSAFRMTKEEFGPLPAWKKAEMKKRLGLF